MIRELNESQRPGVALAEAKIDGNVLANVTMLGRVSKNGRTYSDQAMEDAAALYPGVQVHLDHPKKSELRDRRGVRSVRTIVGRVISAQKVGDQVRGNVELLEVEPTASLVKALAQQMPEAVGLSHRATGEVQVRDGVQVVKSISEVQGVDLVAEPATATLAESICRGEGCDPPAERGPSPVTSRDLEEAYDELFL